MAIPCLVSFTLILALTVNFILPVYGVSEVQALFAFRQSLTDPQNTFESWDETQSTPCTWLHVICNPDNKVSEIRLIGVSLSGSLAPELGQLSALKLLFLNENSITGTIPSELGNLKSLVALDLSKNKLTGKVPAEISKIPQLRLADFSNNDNLCWDFWPTPVFKGSYGLCQKKKDRL